MINLNICEKIYPFIGSAAIPSYVPHALQYVNDVNQYLGCNCDIIWPFNPLLPQTVSKWVSGSWIFCETKPSIDQRFTKYWLWLWLLVLIFIRITCWRQLWTYLNRLLTLTLNVMWIIQSTPPASLLVSQWFWMGRCSPNLSSYN